MLKIAVSFRQKREVLPLIEAGADELYCGYLCPQWRNKYTDLEFERKGGRSNFTDLGQLKKAVELSHNKGVPVFLAINGLYVKRQYPLLLKIISQVNKIDLDGYIIADIGLLLTLRLQGFKKKLHLSTGGTVFNSEAARFYKSLGISRIILDRQLSIPAIKSLCRSDPGMEFEAFILNTLCAYIDGFCTFTHSFNYDGECRQAVLRKTLRGQKNPVIIKTFDIANQEDACRLKYSVAVKDALKGSLIGRGQIRPVFFKHLVDGVECGACALFDMNEAGVKTVKIVGRHLSGQKRLKDAIFIRQVLNIIKDNPSISRDRFMSKTQEKYRSFYNYEKPCRGNNCYHPQLLGRS